MGLRYCANMAQRRTPMNPTAAPKWRKVVRSRELVSCPTLRMSHEGERARGGRMQGKTERAPPHWLNPLGSAFRLARWREKPHASPSNVAARAAHQKGNLKIKNIPAWKLQE